MRQIGAEAGPSVASREFSSETLGELLRALHARAAEHPKSPGLIASWPGVPAERMAAACAELRRRGHTVREVSIPAMGVRARRGWAIDHVRDRAGTPSAAPTTLEGADAMLLLAVADPGSVSAARGLLRAFAEREGAPGDVRSAMALAVTEACANVVMHAYVDGEAAGNLEVRACRADGALTVEVRDEGRGMVPRIDSPGLGLGLPLIAQMADVFEIRARRERPGLILKMQFDLPGRPGTKR